MSRLTEYREDLKRYEYKQDEKGYCFIQEGQIVNKLGKLEDLEEILKNGFIENGRYHRQIFLAYINNDWVICDNETNEKFSLNDVLKG